MKLFLFVAIGLFSVSAMAKSNLELVKNFDSKNIKILKVTNVTGDIRINGKKNIKQANVIAEKVKFDSSCELKVEMQGKTLAAEVERKENYGNLIECRVDFSVEISSEVEVVIVSGAGDLIVSGMASEVDFKLGSGNAVINKSQLSELDGKSGSGNVVVQAEVKEIDISLGSGDVIAEGQFNKLNIKTGSGNVEVTMEKMPISGGMDLKSGVGDITVKLPKGSKLKTKMISGLGDEVNELGTDTSSNYRVKMVSGMGDLSIKKM